MAGQQQRRPDRKIMAIGTAARLGIPVVLIAVSLGPVAGAQKGSPMTSSAKGTFDVTLKPQPADEYADGAAMGRMSIDKVYHGDLEGTGKGQMLTAMGAVKESGVYVAVEKIAGTLKGRSGGFAVHHTGIMNRGAQSLTITIVADSGTGDLAGIAGTMTIEIKDGKHFYALDYALPAAR
jgi:hypothetical protein